MKELYAMPVEAGSGGPGDAVASDASRLLWMSRGFSCLFWSMPLLSMVHTLALMSFLSARWMMGALLACFLPLGCGLGMLRACGDFTPHWGGRMSRVSRLAFAALVLSPFLVWWRVAPMRIYFAVNVAVHYVVMLALLADLNRLAGECALRLGDTPLRREARAGWLMVLWLSACTVGALAWLYYRMGVLAAGLPTLLAQLARLPSEALMLFLLPYAMTAYVMWRAKETGFRHAIGPGP